VQADQAAGLRNNLTRRAVRVVTVFTAQRNLAARLARALQNSATRVLLIAGVARSVQALRTQSIFGWEQQVARQCLQPISVEGIATLNAPGAQAGDAALIQASADYNYVLFDWAYPEAESLALDPRTQQTLIVDVSPQQPEDLCKVYALLKTLHQHNLNWRVILCGEPAVCDRIIAATHYFIPAQSNWLEVASLEADAHLTALAARISAAGVGTSRCFNKNIAGECA
jgi:hypothetical protein